MNNLTAARLSAWKTAINAEATTALVNARTAGNTATMANWYAGNSTIIVWKSGVPRDLVLGAIPIAAMRAQTAGDLAILQTYLMADQVLCGDAQIRGALLNIFPANSLTPAVVTANTQLLALFKRTANRAEAVFATGGAGNDADPHRLVVEGEPTNDEIIAALRA